MLKTDTALVEHRCAYRHDNGEVEGFLGTGFGYDAAVDDAHRQIIRKCDILGTAYRPQQFADTPGGFSAAEMAGVQSDWNATIRY